MPEVPKHCQSVGDPRWAWLWSGTSILDNVLQYFLGYKASNAFGRLLKRFKFFRLLIICDAHEHCWASYGHVIALEDVRPATRRVCNSPQCQSLAGNACNVSWDLSRSRPLSKENICRQIFCKKLHTIYRDARRWLTPCPTGYSHLLHYRCLTVLKVNGLFIPWYISYQRYWT